MMIIVLIMLWFLSFHGASSNEVHFEGKRVVNICEGLEIFQEISNEST